MVTAAAPFRDAAPRPARPLPIRSEVSTLGLFSKKKKSDEEEVDESADASGGDGGDKNPPKTATGGASDGDGDDKKKKEKKTPEELEAEKRDLRKARKFFDYAKTVADSRNFDYAIDCYINGLRHDPESMGNHEALFDVAKRRAVAGGKPAGFRDKSKHSGGKTATERMLNAEFLWAKNFTDPNLSLAVMEHAVNAENYEVAYWIGQIAFEYAQKQKRPNKIMFLKLTDLFEEIGGFEGYEMAVETCKIAAQLAQGDLVLLKRAQDLEAEKMMKKSRVGETGTQVADVAKDIEGQKKLERAEQIAGSDEQVAQRLDDLRAAYQAKPDDIDLLNKVIRGLVGTDNPEHETEAMALMEKAHEQFGQSRYLVMIGDLKIKQKKRQERDLRTMLASADDEGDKKLILDQLKQLAEERLAFELEEYTNRVKLYPTDMGLRFDLGVRQFAVQRYDDAIASFQQAQNEPKRRAWALRYLGECFARKEMHDAAIDTYHRGVSVHPYEDDRLALELKYELTKSLYNKAATEKHMPSAEEARQLASTIAQLDFNYKDIREWVERTRKLTDSIREGQGAA